MILLFMILLRMKQRTKECWYEGEGEEVIAIYPHVWVHNAMCRYSLSLYLVAVFTDDAYANPPFVIHK